MSRYFIGLDLGQSQDYSAACVVEQDRVPESPPPPNHIGTWRARMINAYRVRFLKRWPLATSYPVIVADVRALAAKPPLSGSVLVIDGTGVGRAVVDMVRAAKIKAELRPVVITAGLTASAANGYWHCPKRDLAGLLQTLLQTKRLKISARLPEAKVLAGELMAFRVKVSVAGNETFEAWRERDHDDLVLAVALACWLGERDKGGTAGFPVGTPPGLMMRNPFAPR